MRAIVVEEDPQRTLAWRETTDLKPGPGEVRIRIRATAVNRADLLQRRGQYPVPAGASPILGLEAAGEIEQIGRGVAGWHKHDRVCVLLEGGGYAEHVVVDARMLLPVPAHMTLEDAAALPEAIYTAWTNLYYEGALRRGETALITAGASGIGCTALQMLRALKNPALATASASKLPRLLELGARAARDRAEPDLARWVREQTGGRGVDVVLDMVGGNVLAQHVACLAPGGRLVLVGLLGGAEATLPLNRMLMLRQRIIGSVLRSRTRDEKVALTEQIKRRVWPHVVTGAIKPVVFRQLPIEEAAAAHELLETNQTTGKVVLVVE